MTELSTASGSRSDTAALPLVLRHSWPLWEQPGQFELGHVLNAVITDLVIPSSVGVVGIHHAGCWECNLTDNSLIWSGGVYDIFGLPRETPITRDEVVALYSERSRATMERLRAYCIKHMRGFTLDAEVHAATGASRWMRLIAAPVLGATGRPVRLRGLKLAL